MSASKIPAASAIAAASVAPVARLTVDEMVAQLDGRPLAELFKILKATTALAEKGSKSSATKKGTKKKSDVPMTAEEEEKAAKRSAQLAKPRAWVKFVGEHARANGWPTFPAKVTDKLTGQATMVDMPASVLKDDKHVFPDDKAFNHKHAMSLSTFYWGPKPKKGEQHRCTEQGKVLREAFEAQYTESPASAASSVASSVAVTPDVSDEETDDDEPEEVVASAAASPAPKAKAKAKSESTRWVKPKDGKWNPWTAPDGTQYLRDARDYLLSLDENGEQDEFIGKWNPKTRKVVSCEMPADLAA